MYDYTGWIVRSKAGHDKGELFCVTGIQPPFLLLADGKRRKLASPKRKKLGHTERVEPGGTCPPVIQALKCGDPVSDRALRKALATVKGGNHTWQKTI